MALSISGRVHERISAEQGKYSQHSFKRRKYKASTSQCWLPIVVKPFLFSGRIALSTSAVKVGLSIADTHKLPQGRGAAGHPACSAPQTLKMSAYLLAQILHLQLCSIKTCYKIQCFQINLMHFLRKKLRDETQVIIQLTIVVYTRESDLWEAVYTGNCFNLTACSWLLPRLCCLIKQFNTHLAYQHTEKLTNTEEGGELYSFLIVV